MKILLVEDHQDTANVFSRILLLLGYAVLVTHTKAAARLAAEEYPFDLLLCDINLPDGNGYDLLRELQARQPGLIGIALTAEGNAQRSRAAGFRVHLTKPVSADQLNQAIATARR